MKALHPIGIFDSGIGGLTVLRAVHQLMPDEPLLYLADQAHVPYGPRRLEEVRHFSETITRYLLRQGANLIVVACNTASAAALKYLRTIFPEIPFVGMEPAVKPAAEHTRSGVVGVLATPATFQGELYASVVERFGRGVKLLQHTCPGLVTQIESGYLETIETRRILEEALHPMLEQGIDTVVLGCTHYPFVIPLIQQITGPTVRVIDPAPAVARQVQRLLVASNLLDFNLKNDIEQPGEPSHLLRFATTGDASRLEGMLPGLFGERAFVEKLTWKAGKLIAF
ncbi:MAG: glutamate racemase [Chloroflexi bacterium RBG_13_48_10]|nr:MAG: glutamate racemase [Chloroflexi bacterium RBG_13_48_10]